MGYATAAVVAAAVIAAGAGAYSADQQRRAGNQQADYNAAVAEEDAKAAKAKAEYDEKAHRENVRKILATQRALYGKSGLSMEGSPLLVMEDTEKQGELDALAIRYGGDVASARSRSEANLARMTGRNNAYAAKAGYIQAGSTLLSGAAGAYKYSK
ncbi:MAG: hypothetical protein BWX99_02707 [Deltaproteobacteria bacterium ADurb.Bin151]|nr:MAG: hypothetical protein BWX99_02707 [Deltaproteobacteria bacterium ADurb.Bin151]